MQTTARHNRNKLGIDCPRVRRVLAACVAARKIPGSYGVFILPGAGGKVRVDSDDCPEVSKAGARWWIHVSAAGDVTRSA